MGVFFKRKSNKKVVLDTVCTKDVRRLLPEEIRIGFVEYILKSF